MRCVCWLYICFTCERCAISSINKRSKRVVATFKSKVGGSVCLIGFNLSTYSSTLLFTPSRNTLPLCHLPTASIYRFAPFGPFSCCPKNCKSCLPLHGSSDPRADFTLTQLNPPLLLVSNLIRHQEGLTSEQRVVKNREIHFFILLHQMHFLLLLEEKLRECSLSALML